MPESSRTLEGLPDELRGRMPTLSVIAMPADTNAHGNIFGGWMMSNMDLAAAQQAMEVTGHDIVTRAATISFDRPLNVGDKAWFYTDVTRIGTTSITVKTEAWALRRSVHVFEKVGEGEFVFVAIDKNKNKIAIEPGKP